MEYSVPQFIDVEDKIIGPLTLRQFIIFLVGGLVAFFLWGLFGASVFFFVSVLPVLGVVALIAFGKYNGRSLIAAAPGLLKFYLSPRIRIFKRTAEKSVVMKAQAVKAETPAESSAGQEPHASRLKSLAYLLDQKAAEEERIIHSGDLPQQWVDQT